MSGPFDVLVPPRRLGALLRESRVAAGEDLADVAARSDRLTALDLEEIERGLGTIDDTLLREVVEIYGVDGGELLPPRSRLTIDLDEGLISVDATSVEVESTPTGDDVLARYLALVHRLRGVPIGAAVRIRELDIGVLAAALELSDEEIQRRLTELVRAAEPIREQERMLRRRLLVPLAGVVVATTALGLLVLVDDGDQGIGANDPARVMVRAPSEPAAPAPAVVETDIGEAVVVERGGEETNRG